MTESTGTAPDPTPETLPDPPETLPDPAADPTVGRTPEPSLPAPDNTPDPLTDPDVDAIRAARSSAEADALTFREDPTDTDPGSRLNF